MKGSTLHRSGLTREKMGVLASLAQVEQKHNTKAQLGQYYRETKAKELDLFWNGVQKGVQKVRNVAKTTSTQKSPIVYLSIGFVAGVVFMCAVTLIISLFSIAPKATIGSKDSDIEMISEASAVAANAASTSTSTSEEKYIVKKGDTLNGIAYRFYGKYNEEKINEIQRINNIKNPAAISIGQELIIPVSQEL